MMRSTTSWLKPLQGLCALVIFNTFSAAAFACPLCHTDTGKQVRSGIFGADFAFNLLVTIIPFAIFLAITALIYFGIPDRVNRSKANRPTALSSRT